MNIPIKAARYEPIALSGESTVVAESPLETANYRPTRYQSEAELESAFIAQLQTQAYEYLRIGSEAELIGNLRRQIEKLNKVTFSDQEWDRVFSTCISCANEGIVEKTARIQEDHVQVIKRDDGTTKNIQLIDKSDIHNNTLQVINQYEVEGRHSNRYDVTVLVNGLPMVHIELKRRGVDIREAFNQINRYQRDSFWAGSGLFEYVQLFVISNGTLTKYYSNTTRGGHLDEQRKGGSKSKTSNSYSFTSWWADIKNTPIKELDAFTKTFFAKHSLLNILTRYCVFDINRRLLVMRPYQIAATESILRRIATSTNHKQLGDIQGGGYIWHTTGSGKTLTSFKTALLARGITSVEKVLFVVDRKDLDHQTMQEYDRFEKGAANSNQSTAVLQKQLEDPNARIIITTIQKLSNFVDRNKKHPIYDKHVVIIFDECHRSQFGDMHADITRSFKRYNLFGFTGTPIFAANAGTGGNPSRRTTEQAFGDKLHTYTIVDAINDQNVLPFRIDYIKTMDAVKGLQDSEVSSIDTEAALMAPERIKKIVGYIIEHFAQKTRRGTNYRLDNGTRRSGFNSLFACASIEAAKRYYSEFFAQQRDLPSSKKLKVGMIYTYAANEDNPDGLIDDAGLDADGLDKSARESLEAAIADYNLMFNTSFDTSSERFMNYYSDVSKRLKSGELDIVIVVNMFLTGFDATTLNTLWADKNLKAHGLIQAFSRTNRILNSVKTYGNIVSFRNLEEQTNDALALFGNKDAKGIVLLKPYAEYNEEHKKLVQELLAEFPLGKTILGEKSKKRFVHIFGAILRYRNILHSFDEFDPTADISARDIQDYQSEYLNLHSEFKNSTDAEKQSILEDLVFEIELIKQVEINVDYILELVKRYLQVKGTGKDKEVKADISRAIASSPAMRNKKDLVEDFVQNVSPSSDIGQQWASFMAQQKAAELRAIIEQEGLNADETERFVENAFRDGSLPTAGTAITKCLPPAPRFGPNASHASKKQAVIDRLTQFFERFLGI